MKYFLFFVLFFGCSVKPSEKCLKVRATDGPIEGIACMRKYKARTKPYWEKKRGKSLADRVFIAGETMRSFMEADNKTWGYPDNPTLTKKENYYIKEIVQKVLVTLPKSILKLLKDDFGGVGLLENFGGTGYSTTFVDSKGKIAGAFILLDPSKVIKKANEWNSWKENTPFKDGDYSIEGILENDDENTVEAAVRYIILHEIGHIISNNYGHVPPWEPGASYADNITPGNFERISWKKVSDGFDTIDQFPLRQDILYYWGAKLENKDMIKVYESLEKTSFPTLYAATSIWDDYADSFANFVHVNMLKKDWKIKIKKNDKVVKEVGHCWNEKRCESKKMFFNLMLGLI